MSVKGGPVNQQSSVVPFWSWCQRTSALLHLSRIKSMNSHRLRLQKVKMSPHRSSTLATAWQISSELLTRYEITKLVQNPWYLSQAWHQCSPHQHPTSWGHAGHCTLPISLLHELFLTQGGVQEEKASNGSTALNWAVAAAVENCAFTPAPRTRTQCRSTESRGQQMEENLAIQNGLPHLSSRTGLGWETTSGPSATCNKGNCPKLGTDTKKTPHEVLQLKPEGKDRNIPIKPDKWAVQDICYPTTPAKQDYQPPVAAPVNSIPGTGS